MERVPFQREMGRLRLDGGSGSNKVIGAREESIMVSVLTIGVGAGATSG